MYAIINIKKGLWKSVRMGVEPPWPMHPERFLDKMDLWSGRGYKGWAGRDSKLRESLIRADSRSSQARQNAINQITNGHSQCPDCVGCACKRCHSENGW